MALFNSQDKQSITDLLHECLLLEWIFINDAVLLHDEAINQQCKDSTLQTKHIERPSH